MNIYYKKNTNSSNILQIYYYKQYDCHAGEIFSVYLIINSLNISLKTLWPTTFINEHLSEILGIIFVIYFLKKKIIISNILTHFFFLELIFGIMVISSISRYPYVSSSIIKRCLWQLLFCVPFFVIAGNLKNIERFVSETIYATWFVFVISVIMCLNFRDSLGNQEYSMTLSYMMLYPTLLHTMLISHNKLYIFIVLVEIIIIVLCGSRGALFCSVSFIVLWYTFSKNYSSKILIMKIILVMLGIILTIMINNNSDNILYYLNVSGYNSRTLNLILTGRGISHDSGRSFIHQMIWEKIKEKPLLGWGISGEVSFMNSYSHMIFLDFLLQYGILIGTFFSTLVVILLLCGMVKFMENCKYFFLFLCAGFLPLLASGTYLQSPMFWIVLGISRIKNMEEYHKVLDFNNGK